MARDLYLMPRILLVLPALAALSLQGYAAEPRETTVKLTVEPMAAPKPVLKYLLLPEVSELNPGNAAQWYLRCFAEQRNFFFGKESTEERKGLLRMPLSDIPSLKKSGYGGNALKQADWAARLNTVDWQVQQRIQTDGLDLTQPELGPLNILATALQVRFRIEIAERKFDDAIRTAKTMFAFARHLGENPTDEANQLGLTVAQLALDTVEEMLQQPGCPNLYWALSDLPCPLVDLRKGFQGSGILVATELKAIRDDTCMTDEQLEKVLSRLSGLLGYAREQAGRAPRNFRGAVNTRIKDPEKLQAARKRLLASGVAEGLLPSYPALQVLLIDAKLDYEVNRDERVKLLALPVWQIDALSNAERGASVDGLLSDLLPPVVKQRHAQGRFEQHLAILKHIEALRMFAAAHEGKYPEKLADIGAALPVDPFTGKAFDYEVEGTTAHIRGGSPKSEDKNQSYKLHLIMALKK
jgi:hypothetical protein